MVNSITVEERAVEKEIQRATLMFSDKVCFLCARVLHGWLEKPRTRSRSIHDFHFPCLVIDVPTWCWCGMWLL